MNYMKQNLDTNESIITKGISKRIQGIAILMMIIHHTFGFPEKILQGITYIGIMFGTISVETSIGQLCKLCVSIFAFGTGFGLVFTKIDRSYLFRKIFNLFKLYWFSLVLFITAKLSSGYSISLKEFVLNVIAYSSSLNHASWYLSFYVITLITMWAMRRIKKTFTSVLFVCLISLIFNNIINNSTISIWSGVSYFFIYFPVVWIGMVCSSNSNLQNIMYQISIKRKGLLFSVLFLVIILIMRMLTGSEIYGFRFIWIYAPFIYLCLGIILFYMNGIRILNKILETLGNYSTEFWLFNAIFTSGIYWIQWLAFLPKFSFLIILWEFILMFFIAKLYRKIYSCFSQIRKEI